MQNSDNIIEPPGLLEFKIELTDPPVSAPPQCLDCKHYTYFGNCSTFPNGIPEDIYYGDHDHRKPYPGDNGIRFEPK